MKHAWTIRIEEARLKMFLSEAEKNSLTIDGSVRLVRLRTVKDLLYNLATGKDHDYKRPPYWAGKDVVGLLMRRGWKVTEDQDGMHRRGYFIPADAIENCGVMGSESAADILEIEHAERTDRPDETRLPSGERLSNLLGPVEVDCPDCLASGPRKDCPRCGGTGEVKIL